MQLDYQLGTKNESWPLADGRHSIGRDPDCDLCLEADGVSKRHATIEVEGDFVEIFDADSRNGLRVNGQRAASKILVAGDEIKIGSVRLVLSAGGEPTVSAARGSAAKTSAPERGAPLGRYRLRQLSDDRCFALEQRLETLGQREKNTIVLSADGVSRYHCKVEHKDGGWFVQDLDSRNGVLFAPDLDSEPRPVQRQALSPGAVIHVGSSELVFEELEAPAAAAGGRAPGSTAIQAAVEAEVRAPAATPPPWLGKAVLALVLLLTALGLARELIPGPRPAPVVELGDGFETYEESIVFVIEKLAAGDLPAATRIMGRATSLEPDHPATTPLQTVVKAWRWRDDPGKFPHADVVAALKELQRYNLPLPVDRFARATEPGLSADMMSVDRLARAREAIALAKAARSARDPDAANGHFRLAITLLASVPEASSFHAEAQRLAKEQLGDAYTLLRDHAETAQAARDWPKARRYATQGLAFALDQSERAKLEQVAKKATTNIYAEGAYQRAVSIVRSRDVDRYEEALELLKTVSEDSDVATSAREWHEWCRADLAKRRATTAFKNAKGSLALELLDQALGSSAVDDQAKRTLTRQRDLWQKVVSAFEAGQQAIEAGQSDAARASFGAIVALITDDQNVYLRLSRARLKSLAESPSDAPENHLERLYSALSKRRWSVATRLLAGLTRRARDAEERATLGALVSETESRESLLKEAHKSILRADKKRYPELRLILTMLGEHLPAGDKRRQRARDLLSKLPRQP